MAWLMVIPGLLSDVNNVHQTSISLLIVAPERRFVRGWEGYIQYENLSDGRVLNLKCKITSLSSSTIDGKH